MKTKKLQLLATASYRRMLSLFVITMLFTHCVKAITPTTDCSTGSGSKITVGAVGSCTNTAFNFNTSIGLPALTGSCVSAGTQDGWGWFTATSAYTKITTSGSNRNIALMVYSGSCGSLTLIGCADNANGSGSETVTIATTSGNNYFVRIVRRRGTGGTSNNNICIAQAAAPPANDACSGAIALTVNSTCVSVSGSTIGCLQSLAPATCSGNTAASALDVFYKFIANNTTQNVRVTGTGGFNPIVQAFSGDCSSLNSLGCINATGNNGTENLVLSGLTVGNTYYVRVYGRTNTGNFNICVSGTCLTPTLYNVGGGGTYCANAGAPAITLSGSQVGFSYQLRLNGTNTGSPVAGTGSALSFGAAPGNGTYTVQAANTGVSGCSALMNGNAVVSQFAVNQFTVCPSNINVNTDAGNCTALVNYTASATGQPSPSLSYTFSGATTGSGTGTGTGMQFNTGTTTVTITASNGCSADVQCAFDITVQDAENPSIGCVSNQQFCAVAGDVYTVPAISAQDNCGIASVSYSITGSTIRSGSGNDASGVFNEGISTVQFTVTDINGNTNQCSFTVTILPVLPTPGLISGPTDACPLVGSTNPTTYSIAPVAGAQTYTWTVPVGTTIVSGQGTNSIQVLFDNSFALTNSRFRVVAESATACTSQPSVLEVLKIIPGIPVAINGPTNVCPFIGQPANAVYSVAPVPNATSYLWVVPAGATIVSGQGTASVSVSFTSFTSGSIRVTATANCGSRSPRSLTLTKLVPSAPAAINGPVNVCQYLGNNVQATYSIDAVTNATSYVWTVPAGVTIVSGQGTTSINVTFAANYTTGAIKVKSVSNCSMSSDRSLTVLTTTYAAPGAISGPSDACSYITTGSTATYTIRKVNNAPAYLWSVPSGATIVDHPAGIGVNDTIIEVLYNNNLLNNSLVSVQTTGCATSVPSTLTITRLAATTAVPGLINGPRSLCEYMVSPSQPNGATATYSIRKVNNAVAYLWLAPANATIVAHPAGLGVNDTIVEVIYNNQFTSGVLNVAASSGCGFGGNRSLNVTRFTPSAVGAIDVIQLTDCPNRQFSYSLANLPGNSTGVQWTVPAEGTIVSGQGTTSIIVDYPSTAVNGTITATAQSNCGISAPRLVSVKLAACINSFKGAKAGKNADIKQEGTAMSIFPNPSTTDFNLQVITAGAEKITVRISDMQGRQIRKFTVLPNETVKFGSELKAGIYQVEITSGDKVRTQRIMKL
jgi:hypothetical protein